MKLYVVTFFKIPILSIIVFLCMQSVIPADPPEILWIKNYGINNSYWDVAYSVQQTSDGGFIIGGCLDNSLFLIRTDSNGDSLWTKTYCEEYYGGSCGSLLQTSDGGFVVAGGKYTDSINCDAHLMKTDSNGDTLWTKIYGGDFTDYFRSIEQTDDGGYIMAGITASFGAGGADIYLVRTDSIGDTIWTRTYGGDSSDVGYSVQETSDGGFIVAGETELIGTGYRNIFLVRTDNNGDTLWTKVFGDKSAGAKSVRQTQDGGFIITGKWDDVNTRDVCLVRTDSNGDILWTRTYGEKQKIEEGNALVIMDDGGFMVAGYGHTNKNRRDFYVVRTDSSGNALWKENYGSDSGEIAYSLAKTNDGGVIITGYSRSFGPGANVYLVRLGKDSVGNKEKNISISNKTIFITSFPNPFSRSTTITYSTGHPGQVSINIYNLSGKRIRTLLNQYKTSGKYSVQWDGTGDRNMPVSKGVYNSLITIDTGTEKIRQRQKMVLE